MSRFFVLDSGPLGASATPGRYLAVASEQTKGKNLLLFDDLRGSGATVGAIVELLKGTGQAKAVYLLTLTTR